MNRDPIGEDGGLNLCAFVANTPGLFIDPVGLTIRYAGPHADSYERLILCWVCRRGQKTKLREILKDIITSSHETTIAALHNPGDTPNTQTTGTFQPNATPPSTIRINPQSYTYQWGGHGRTWTFAEALAHELLHVYDILIGNHRPDQDDTFISDEAAVTRDAREASCDE